MIAPSNYRGGDTRWEGLQPECFLLGQRRGGHHRTELAAPRGGGQGRGGTGRGREGKGGGACSSSQGLVVFGFRVDQGLKL